MKSDKLTYNFDNSLTLSKGDFLVLLDAYNKIGITLGQIKVKIEKPVKSLYGIWGNANIPEEEINKAKKSLFKTSL